MNLELIIKINYRSVQATDFVKRIFYTIVNELCWINSFKIMTRLNLNYFDLMIVIIWFVYSSISSWNIFLNCIYLQIFLLQAFLFLLHIFCNSFKCKRFITFIYSYFCVLIGCNGRNSLFYKCDAFDKNPWYFSLNFRFGSK